MGAYAPVSVATAGLAERVEREILLPTLRAMEADGAPFQGLLYAGLMLTTGGPKVVEFNCRFGDPETQVVLPLMGGSLLEPLATIAQGGAVAGMTAPVSSGGAVTTVLASQGYPGSYQKGVAISIPDQVEEDPSIVVFHAGTRKTPEGLATSGGRVLAVTGFGDTLADAARKSLTGADAISFEGKYFRTDIGWREFARDEGRKP
jgi:phosphoribosylamine--glycine ligase